MNPKRVKLGVSVPLSHADIVRAALGSAGAGKVGNYEFCSFSMRGIGRFRGNEHSNPVIGQKEVLEAVEEEWIEVICEFVKLPEIIAALKAVHPYEEPTYDVIPLLDF